LKNSYYIFRHGETFSTRDGTPYGERQFEAEILPQGVPAIKRLAEKLKDRHFDYYYTSELLRCLQTSQIVASVLGVEFEKNKLLNEMLEPGFVEFRNRVKTLVAKMEEEEYKAYLLCTHGAVISALKHLLVFGKYEEENLLDYPIPGTLMVINRSGSEILDFNS